MSNFVLYHGLGIRGYEHVRADDTGGRLVFTIRQRRETWRCSHCQSANVHSRGHVEREWRTVPLGLKPVFVRMAVPRVLCLDCGLTRQVQVRFASEKVRYTKALARYALELSKHMTIQDVADHLGIGWDGIKEIQRRHLERHYSRPKLRRLREIAIDEISIGQGHQYLTVVLDLESGAVVFLGEGKGVEALAPFWKRLRCSRARIQAVAIDMSPAYGRAVRDNLPEAVVVFDHFHIVKWFNEQLSELRRELYREAKEKLHKDVLKGTRWLLLKNPENLDHERGEHRRLAEALKLNESLAKAYYLKDELRELWNQLDKRSAAATLDHWIVEAEYSGVRRLMKMARTLQIHRDGILAWYDYRISTGPLEGTNTKIQLMKRQAYGFRDLHFLKLKIFAIHEAQYALLG